MTWYSTTCSIVSDGARRRGAGDQPLATPPRSRTTCRSGWRRGLERPVVGGEDGQAVVGSAAAATGSWASRRGRPSGGARGCRSRTSCCRRPTRRPSRTEPRSSWASTADAAGTDRGGESAAPARASATVRRMFTDWSSRAVADRPPDADALPFGAPRVGLGIERSMPPGGRLLTAARESDRTAYGGAAAEFVAWRYRAGPPVCSRCRHVEPNVLLPFLSSALSFVFALFLLDQWLERRRPYQLIWMLGHGLVRHLGRHGVLGGAFGWSEPLYRAWYLFGAFYVAAWLGLGTMFLLAKTRFGYGAAISILGAGRSCWPVAGEAPVHGHRRAPVCRLRASRVVGGVLIVVETYRGTGRWARIAGILIIGGSIAVAPLVALRADRRPRLPLDANGIPVGTSMPGSVRLLTPLFNVTGGFALALGALYSTYCSCPRSASSATTWPRSQGIGRFLVNLAHRAVRDHHQPPSPRSPGRSPRCSPGKLDSRVPATILIAIGGFIPSMTSGLSRFGVTETFFLGELLGVIFLFAGFLVSIEVFREFRIPFTHRVLRARSDARGAGPGAAATAASPERRGTASAADDLHLAHRRQRVGTPVGEHRDLAPRRGHERRGPAPRGRSPRPSPPARPRAPTGPRPSSGPRRRSPPARRRRTRRGDDVRAVLDRPGAQEDLPVVAPGPLREHRRHRRAPPRRPATAPGTAPGSAGRSRSRAPARSPPRPRPPPGPPASPARTRGPTARRPPRRRTGGACDTGRRASPERSNRTAVLYGRRGVPGRLGMAARQDPAAALAGDGRERRRGRSRDGARRRPEPAVRAPELDVLRQHDEVRAGRRLARERGRPRDVGLDVVTRLELDQGHPHRLHASDGTAGAGDGGGGSTPGRHWSRRSLRRGSARAGGGYVAEAGLDLAELGAGRTRPELRGPASGGRLDQPRGTVPAATRDRDWSRYERHRAPRSS